MHTVEVYFFDGLSTVSSIKVPTMILVSCAFVIGFLIAWSFEIFTQFKLKSQLREKEKRIERLEQELLKLNQSSSVSLELKDNSLSNT
jgi:uncharacterized membrane protein YciS (DUF1049 family)